MSGELEPWRASGVPNGTEARFCMRRELAFAHVPTQLPDQARARKIVFMWVCYER